MKIIILFVLMAIVIGCGEARHPKPMTSEETILQHKKCEEAGMDTELTRSFWDGTILHIQCIPKKGKPQ